METHVFLRPDRSFPRHDPLLVWKHGLQQRSDETSSSVRKRKLRAVAATAGDLA
jgi:hypothetical protein